MLCACACACAGTKLLFCQVFNLAVKRVFRIRPSGQSFDALRPRRTSLRVTFHGQEQSVDMTDVVLLLKQSLSTLKSGQIPDVSLLKALVSKVPYSLYSLYLSQMGLITVAT